MPALYILAGPNGTGKTTFYSIAVLSGFIDKKLPFINVDIITQKLGGYNEDNYVKASEIYRDTVKKYIESNEDFMIESNLADSRSYEWISLIKAKNYQIILYYLSTDDVLINIGRVQRRVAEGGHDIPESIIRTRYSQSHSYLKTKLSEFNEVYLIDNSTDTSQIQVKLVDGLITEKAQDLQKWVKEIISIQEFLLSKKPPK
jgi:predicted ABC-type ATPase